MAMTAMVKDELSRVECTKTSERKAEVTALLRFSGGLHIVGGRVVIEAELDTGSVARRLRRDISEVYGYTSGVSVLQAHLGGVALHTVIADADSVVDRRGLLSAVRECGAELVLAPVAELDGAPRHDPGRLSSALASVVGAR